MPVYHLDLPEPLSGMTNAEIADLCLQGLAAREQRQQGYRYGPAALLLPVTIDTLPRLAALADSHDLELTLYAGRVLEQHVLQFDLFLRTKGFKPLGAG